jgi:hypothetical protein
MEKPQHEKKITMFRIRIAAMMLTQVESLLTFFEVILNALFEKCLSEKFSNGNLFRLQCGAEKAQMDFSNSSPSQHSEKGM